MDVDVDLARAQDMASDPEVQVVDVREDYEHEAGHIAGSRLIGLAQLTQAAETLDRDRPLLFYCRVGARSRMAAQAFRQAGFDAYSLAGGLMQWHASGRPIEPEDGEVAPH